MFRRISIRSFEVGLRFVRGEFRDLVGPGVHWVFDPLGRQRLEIVSQRAPFLLHEQLDLMVRSGALEGRAQVFDLKADERGLAWVDGRFAGVLAPGLHAAWTGFRDVRVEVVKATGARFAHPQVSLADPAVQADRALEIVTVEANHVGVLFEDGKIAATLPAGRHAFWRNVAAVKVAPVDLRESVVDVTGQDVMTADKVTLRLNAVLSFRVTDAPRSVAQAADVKQTLYRDAQLALRAAVGVRELDAFLADKDAVAAELLAILRQRAVEYGLEVLAFGVRDLILPGEMKELLNKVIEARKEAEANVIVRREETAAMRSQANTAKLLQDNPTLMRLRELEILEKIAAGGKLQIVVGEKGLADRIVNLL
ncbi:MAG TPA: slipin family protein [Planctomycetia bacterium]|nr:slipin family protein [Planctomycetia bacterium]